MTIKEALKEVLFSCPTCTWTIAGLSDELWIRLGIEASQNEIRLAVWDLIDEALADITTDRKIIARLP